MKKLSIVLITIMLAIGLVAPALADSIDAEHTDEDYTFSCEKSSFKSSSYKSKTPKSTNKVATSATTKTRSYKTPSGVYVHRVAISRPIAPVGTTTRETVVYRDNGMGMMETLILYEILSDDGQVVNNYYGDEQGNYFEEQQVAEGPGFSSILALACICGAIFLVRRR